MASRVREAVREGEGMKYEQVKKGYMMGEE